MTLKTLFLALGLLIAQLDHTVVMSPTSRSSDDMDCDGEACKADDETEEYYDSIYDAMDSQNDALVAPETGPTKGCSS